MKAQLWKFSEDRYLVCVPSLGITTAVSGRTGEEAVERVRRIVRSYQDSKDGSKEQPQSPEDIVRVTLKGNENRGYVAEAPSLPGCLSQGETIPDAAKNIAEAVELWRETKCDENPYQIVYELTLKHEADNSRAKDCLKTPPVVVEL